jgi:hypothetical protein
MWAVGGWLPPWTAGRLGQGCFKCGFRLGAAGRSAPPHQLTTNRQYDGQPTVNRPRSVMTVSFHKYGDFFFPGTGDLVDVGEMNGTVR